MSKTYPGLLRALRHRNYRLYFSGQIISVAGTWMQQIAMSWLVYRLTGSLLMLGVVTFASQIPILALAPVGGVLCDRYDKRRLLLATQALALLQAALLAALTLSGLILPWHLVVLSLTLGVIAAIDTPARQSFVVQLVEERSDLANAIALNSFTVNLARFVGPSLGGLVVAAAGEGVCFLLNAASYLGLIVALKTMRTRREETMHVAPLDALRQGIRYAYGHRRIRNMLLLLAAVSFFLTPYAMLLPYFAREVYGGSAQTYGFMMAAAGAGALLGTVFLAARRSVKGLEQVIGRAALVAGVALAAFAATSALWLALATLVVLGFCVISTVATSNTAIQAMVEDGLRGRVMALFTMSFLGISPLGSLAAGSLAQHLGARATLAGCSLAVAGAAGLFIRAQARRYSSGSIGSFKVSQ